MAAVAALAVAAVVIAIVLLSSGGGTRYRMVFQTAGQLVKGEQVQVGGRPIGSVKDIQLTNDNLARVTVELNELTPLHRGSTAVIQPGGSMRDDEVIKAADDHGIAMVFTGVRHFRH